MLTPAQEKWIANLSDQDTVTILPYDPSALQKFEAVRQKLLEILGPDARIEHRGATSFGISGQDEIDVYVPVSAVQFNAMFPLLEAEFGSPRSHYAGDRARFVTIADGKHVDIFLIIETSQSWINGDRFDAYLRSHPEALEKYRQLKEAGHGLSVREYYRRKTGFINQVLALADG